MNTICVYNYWYQFSDTIKYFREALLREKSYKSTKSRDKNDLLSREKRHTVSLLLFTFNTSSRMFLCRLSRYLTTTSLNCIGTFYAVYSTALICPSPICEEEGVYWFANVSMSVRRSVGPMVGTQIKWFPINN